MSNKRISEASWQQSNKRVRTTSNLDIAPLGTARETDPRKLEQRQKQIGYGKNSLAYQRYLEEVPMNRRSFDLINTDHPRTPDIARDVSKRTFDGQIKAWRRQLHLWDPPDAMAAQATFAPRPDAGSEPAVAPPPSGFDDFLGIDEDEDGMTAEDSPPSAAAAAVAAADPRTERSRDGGLFNSGLLEEDDDVPEYYYKGEYHEYHEVAPSSKPRSGPSQAKRPAEEPRRAPAAAAAAAAAAPAAAPAPAPAAAHEPLRARLDAFKPNAERSIYDAYDGDALR